MPINYPAAPRSTGTWKFTLLLIFAAAGGLAIFFAVTCAYENQNAVRSTDSLQRNWPGGVQPAFDWITDYAAARQLAREKNLPLLVDFTADWCGPCRDLDARVFSSSQVAAAATGRYIMTRVDLTQRIPGTQEAKVADRFGISSIPAVLVVDPTSGRVKAKLPSDQRTIQGFITFLQQHAG